MAACGNTDSDWFRSGIEYTRCDLGKRFDSKKAQAYLGLLCCLTGSLGSATLPLLLILLVIYVLAALRRVLLGRILRSLLLS